MRRPLPPGALGPATRLREIWQRYRIPVAVTEVHHGASRDEQLRWLIGFWHSLRELAAEGWRGAVPPSGRCSG
ncbi:hypothetical protein BKE38_18975 [Pseudoroseomonas deserti]|uniref:Uncharacterized protein n=1 Tax=Teichococcus deserti TaxID=1817963 RepID=A0A1V2GYP0_9PROT|nr:hypothetical protein [Pseudoroseomonas deserti]ONG50167.1 hypothetical protein BKE38_18975 [Pseudoroseomonas deserti]